MYSVEGAFTITIFTALFMAILSIISVVKTEIEIQTAINELAKSLSMYSYVVTGKASSDEETTYLRTILSSAKREAIAHSTGSIICQKMLEDKIDEKALSLVEDGFEGIDFLSSSVLGDGETIKIVAIYKIQINAFGFLSKTLNVRQEAKTYAWLPLDAEELSVEQDGDGSIWDETNFTRGKYFVSKLKEEQRGNVVSSGQGIDLYEKTTGTVSEIYSINVFDDSYSYEMSPNSENITKQIEKYVYEFEEDIENIGESIELESGATEKFLAKNKKIIIVVPEEAKDIESFTYCFNEISKEIFKNSGILIEFVYLEEAL